MFFEFKQTIESVTFLSLFQKLTNDNIQLDTRAKTTIFELFVSCPTLILQLFMACYLFELINNEVNKTILIQYSSYNS